MQEHLEGRHRRGRFLFESVRALNAPMVAQGGAFIWRADARLSLLDGIENAFNETLAIAWLG